MLVIVSLLILRPPDIVRCTSIEDNSFLEAIVVAVRCVAIKTAGRRCCWKLALLPDRLARTLPALPPGVRIHSTAIDNLTSHHINTQTVTTSPQRRTLNQTSTLITIGLHLVVR